MQITTIGLDTAKTVRRWAQTRRQGLPATLAESAAAWPAPSKRRCARLLTSREEDLDPKERSFVLHLGSVAPTLVEAAKLVQQCSAGPRRARCRPPPEGDRVSA